MIGTWLIFCAGYATGRARYLRDEYEDSLAAIESPDWQIKAWFAVALVVTIPFLPLMDLIAWIGGRQG